MAGDLTLITGISGFLGYATFIKALESGYRVRGVVRKESQVNEFRNKLPSTVSDSAEFVVIPDLTVDGAFNQAIEGVAYIIHFASPVGKASDNFERDYFRPAIDMTLNVLSAAEKSSTVKRVVLCSSVSPYIPIMDYVSGKLQKEVILSDDEIQHYKIEDQFPHHLFAYAASKSMTLDTAEEFVKARKLLYDVVYLAPSYVLGPDQTARTAEEFSRGSNAILLNALLGKPGTPPLSIGVHIDDVANAHVKALNPSVPAGRYFLDSAGAQDVDWSQALPIVKKYFPESVGKVFPEEVTIPVIKCQLDGTKAEKVFGFEFKSFEEQVKDTVAYYLSLIK